MQKFGLVLVVFILSLLRPSQAHTHRRYTPEQIQQLIQNVRQKKVQEAQQKDKTLQKLRLAEATLQKQRNLGKCKQVDIPFLRKKCTKSCLLYRPKFRTTRSCVLWKPLFTCKKKVFGKCVFVVPTGKKCVKHTNIPMPDGKTCVKHGNICYPVKVNKHLELCIKPYKGSGTLYINGKRDPVLPAMRTFVTPLKKAYNLAEQQIISATKKIAQESQKRASQVAKEAIAKFEKTLFQYRKAAHDLAQKLANTPEWKQKIALQLTVLATSKLAQASTFARGKMYKKLLSLLRAKNRYNTVKSTMESEQKKARKLRSYGKSAIKSLATTISYQALRISIVCWKKSGQNKRTCLRHELTVGMRDALFDIVGALVLFAVDLKVIEPLSHVLAAMVATKLAAITAGLGAIAYPTAYAASSFALNGAIMTSYEAALRPKYNKLYEQHLRRDVESFNGGLLDKLPHVALQCWGPCN